MVHPMAIANFSSIAKPREFSSDDTYLQFLTYCPFQINYRMRVTLNDGRQMTGQMLAFDKV